MKSLIIKRVEQHTGYCPYGEPWREPAGQPYLFGGKERRRFASLGDSDFHARFLTTATALWQAPDGKYPWLSPWVFCAANPVRYEDPTGMDWREVLNPTLDENGEFIQIRLIEYTNCKNQEGMDENCEMGRYLGNIVVDIEGSLDEQLGTKNGEWGFIDGESAVTAEVTVYGQNGKDDIGEYKGFTMSSDYKKYGAIADGEYEVDYYPLGKSGQIKSNYRVNKGGFVDCIDGKNPNPGADSTTQKNGVYVHRTNWNGKASGTVSTGCILIEASPWVRFEKQIGKNDFKMILRR